MDIERHCARASFSLVLLVILGCGSDVPPATAPEPASPPAPLVTVSSGESVSLPEGFPEDVPLYDGMKIESVSALPGAQAYVVQATTPDSLEQVDAALSNAAEARGWRESAKGPPVRDTSMALRNYEKEKRTLNITVFQQDGGAVINLSTDGA